MKFYQKLLLSLLFLSIATNAFAITNFALEVRDSSGDYTSTSLAETGIDEDITAVTTKVFSFDANSGTIPDGTAVTTDGGGTDGTVIHQSINGQVLIMNIANGTFDDDDVVTDGSNTVTLSDSGDGAKITITTYDDGAWGDTDGGTYDIDNTLSYIGDTSGWDGTIAGAIEITGRNIIKDSYVDVSYFHLKDGYGNYAIKNDGSNSVVLHDLFFTGAGYIAWYGCTTMYNAFIVDADADGVAPHCSNIGAAKFYNITIINSTTEGFDDAYGTGRTHAENIFSCGSGGNGDFENVLGTSDHLASCDESADDEVTNYLISLTLADELLDAGNGNYHIKAGSNLIGAGGDISGTFTTDIDGDTRSAWDIGADEYIVAGRTRRVFLTN